MDPLTLGLILGGTSLLKSAAIDQPAANRKRWIESEKTRYSPWTGMQGGDVEDPDHLGGALQGAASGYLTGKSLQGADAALANQKEQTALLTRMSQGLSPTGDTVAMGGQVVPIDEVLKQNSTQLPRGRWMR